jgi:hypothetical protein
MLTGVSVDGETVVHSATTAELHHLDRSAAAVWTASLGGATGDALLAEVATAAEAAVDPHEVWATVDELRRLGLLEAVR